MMSAAPNQPVGDGDVYGDDFPQLAQARNAGYDMAVINGRKYPLSVVINVLMVIYEMLADPHYRAILVWAIEIIEERGIGLLHRRHKAVFETIEIVLVRVPSD